MCQFGMRPVYWPHHVLRSHPDSGQSTPVRIFPKLAFTKTLVQFPSLGNYVKILTFLAAASALPFLTLRFAAVHELWTPYT